MNPIRRLLITLFKAKELNQRRLLRNIWRGQGAPQ